MSKKHIVVLWLAIGIAIIMAGFSLHISLNNNYRLQFDANTFIVGIITILVTFLVGWNIYSLINAKEDLKEIEQLKRDVESFKDTTKKLITEETNKIRSDFWIWMWQMQPFWEAFTNTNDIVYTLTIGIQTFTGMQNTPYKTYVAERILNFINGTLENRKDQLYGDTITQLSKEISVDEINNLYSYYLQLSEEEQNRYILVEEYFQKLKKQINNN